MTGPAGKGAALPSSDMSNKAGIGLNYFKKIIHLLCMHKSFYLIQLYLTLFVLTHSHIMQILHFERVFITKGAIFCFVLI
jgi:hypothetical protein